LIYPDQKICHKLPSSEENFSVERYKSFLGKPYGKVNLFLCLETEYLNPETRIPREKDSDENGNHAGENENCTAEDGNHAGDR